MAGIELWNDRHPEFAIDDQLIAQNVYAPFDGLDVAAWGSYDGDDLVGFALGKTLAHELPDYAGPERGWISLLAFDRDAGNPRVARDLLEIAEADLSATGVETLRFGGDPQNFLAGLPTDLGDDYRALLVDAGFEHQRTVYDLASEITSFGPSERVETLRAGEDDLAVERVEPGRSADDLLAFLDDQFPGRWRYEAENIRRVPGGIVDYWVLRHAGSVVGFARTNAPDSAYRGPNANWGWRLGEDHGGLGPLGVHEEYRGRGWGLFMLSGIIEALRDEGFEHVVIDWTTLVDYYGKLGFEPWLAYETFVKEL